jgi:hypothetical protein
MKTYISLGEKSGKFRVCVHASYAEWFLDQFHQLSKIFQGPQIGSGMHIEFYTSLSHFVKRTWKFCWNWTKSNASYKLQVCEYNRKTRNKHVNDGDTRNADEMFSIWGIFQGKFFHSIVDGV